MLKIKFFSLLLNKTLRLAKHRHAPYYLAGVSFIESSIFPIPPDFMLAPMSFSHPQKAFQFATITTFASVLGGILGYCIGALLIDLISPIIISIGYAHAYQMVLQKFNHWGPWIILAAGFTPLPYKLFTIGAGAVHMALLPFILFSIIGRGARFFLVAAFIAWGGPRMEALLYRYVERIGWFFLLFILIIFFWVQWR